jgi:hypothetical protein
MALIILCSGIGFTSLYSQKKAINESAQDKGGKPNGVSGLHKRLADAIVNGRVQPDSEGKCSFVFSSGSYYDSLERQKLVYNIKADVYMSQGKISKIVFVYYQFSMTSQIREVKTITNSSLISDDLGLLEVNYETNTGETQSYKVGDLQSGESREAVISQYSSYLDSLVNYLEIHKTKSKAAESNNINRTIILGK